MFLAPFFLTVLTRSSVAEWSQKQGLLSTKPAADAPGKSLLVLKTARTGSTWLCEELNKRGMHITQEALLNWEGECKDFGENCDEYFTKEGRLGWVTQSLLRPMPKTPYALDGGCATLIEKSQNFTKELFHDGQTTEAKKATCAVKAECRPPYEDETCSDLRGCFNQRLGQSGCYNAEMRKPTVTGISFNYLSSLGDAEVDACIESDTNCMSKQAEMLRGAKEAAQQQGAEVLTLAQLRSNLLRWAISKAFHSLHAKDVKFNKKGDKLTILDVVSFVGAPALRVEELLQLSPQVSESAQLIFYEDLARDVENSVAGVMQSYQSSKSSELKPADDKVATSANEQDQHPGGLEAYVENIEEVREQVRDSYPCIFRMTENAKEETLILPLSEQDGQVKVDFSRDCCVADKNEYIRSVADYIKAGLECS